MTRRAREIEMLLLAMLAAVPLYFTYAVGTVPLLVFHTMMAAMTIRVASGRGPDVVPPVLMRAVAVAYIGFYLIDAAVISRSAIAASTHLVLFIAAYQPIESLQRNNLSQRLLTTGLIFIASLATSTHIVIVPFVLLFGFLMFRQMLYVSHMETIRVIGHPYAMAPVSRAAMFYIAGATLIGAALFPILPRLRNPLVPGMTGGLANSATGLSESINFNQSRSSVPDPAVVARIWMSPDAMPFFTPLRLRGAVYDSYSSNQWLQTKEGPRYIRHQRGVYRIARPLGFARVARVQQMLTPSDGRLYLPAGTYAVTGLRQLLSGSSRGSYVTIPRSDSVTYEASMSRSIEPLEAQPVGVPEYPAPPPIAALARQIAGGASGAEERARLVERHLLGNYEYVQRPEEIGRTTMSVEEFLLTVRKGHCEYFAAGMVTLLTTLDVPARIVGGFYGGRINPLTGYLVIRRADAHAWVEVWNGARWVTYDPTPPSLRPGASQGGFVGSYISALSESATYFWDRYVLTFGLGDQVVLALEIISRARAATRTIAAKFGQAYAAARSPAMIAVYAGLLALALLLWVAPLRRRPAFDALVRHLRALGIEVGPAMTLEEALEALRGERPDEAERLAPLVALYEEEQFSGRPDRDRRRTLRRRLAELRA